MFHFSVDYGLDFGLGNSKFHQGRELSERRRGLGGIVLIVS